MSDVIDGVCSCIPQSVMLLVEFSRSRGSKSDKKSVKNITICCDWRSKLRICDVNGGEMSWEWRDLRKFRAKTSKE